MVVSIYFRWKDVWHIMAPWSQFSHMHAIRHLELCICFTMILKDTVTHTDLAWSFHPMINPTRAQSWDHWSIEAWTPSPMSRTKALRALPAPGMQTGGNEINGWRHMGYIIYRSIDSYIHTKNADNFFFADCHLSPTCHGQSHQN